MTRDPNDSELDESLRIIPNSSIIVNEALAIIPSENLSIDYVRNNFSEMTVLLERTAYETFLNYEKQALVAVVKLWVSKNITQIGERKTILNDEDLVTFICTAFWAIAKRLEMRLGQMRKSRAGAAFEMIIQFLLTKIGIQCQKPSGPERKTMLNRIDLVVPNQTIAVTRPDQARYLSCKRTLRERWKQSVPERKVGWTVYLITLDKSLSEEKANEINDRGLIAYIKDDLKQEEHLKMKPWIRTLSDLPTDLKR